MCAERCNGGDVVFLHEKFTPKSLLGCILIGAGTLVMVL